MSVRVIVLTGVLAASLALWKSAAHSRPERLEQGQWLNPEAQEKLLGKEPTGLERFRTAFNVRRAAWCRSNGDLG